PPSSPPSVLPLLMSLSPRSPPFPPPPPRLRPSTSSTDPPTTDIYPLSLHDALPIFLVSRCLYSSNHSSLNTLIWLNDALAASVLDVCSILFSSSLIFFNKVALDTSIIHPSLLILVSSITVYPL